MSCRGECNQGRRECPTPQACSEMRRCDFEALAFVLLLWFVLLAIAWGVWVIKAAYSGG